MITGNHGTGSRRLLRRCRSARAPLRSERQGQFARWELFFRWRGDQSFPNSLLAGKLAGSPDGLGPFSRFSFRWLFVRTPLLHFSKDAFALHFLFENAESLIDVVIADEYLQFCVLQSLTRNRAVRRPARLWQPPVHSQTAVLRRYKPTQSEASKLLCDTATLSPKRPSPSREKHGCIQLQSDDVFEKTVAGTDLQGPRPIERIETIAPIPKFASYCGPSDANFGIKGALATYCFECGFEFEVPMTNSRRN